MMTILNANINTTRATPSKNINNNDDGNNNNDDNNNKYRHPKHLFMLKNRHKGDHFVCQVCPAPNVSHTQGKEVLIRFLFQRSTTLYTRYHLPQITFFS